jgi:hypothetical protein
MSEGPLNELEVPDAIRDAESAVEVLRCWIGDGALHVTFDPTTFAHDVNEWGRLLSDVAHHIAKAVALDGQMESHEALTQIRQTFDHGIQTNPVTTSGKIKGRTRH